MASLAISMIWFTFFLISAITGVYCTTTRLSQPLQRSSSTGLGSDVVLQQGHHRIQAFGSSLFDRGPASLVLDVHIGRVVQEQLHQVHVAQSTGVVKRRVSPAVPGVDADVALQEEASHGRVVVHARLVQRSVPHEPLSVHVRALLDQKRHEVGVTLSGGHVQRRSARRLDVDVGSVLHEQLGRCQVTRVAGRVQGRDLEPVEDLRVGA